MDIAAPLSEADAVVQSMPDASPEKWRLAHTTWFFETMVLAPNVSSYQAFDESFSYLFNWYYESSGERHPRPQRGLITRLSLAAARDYRRHVDTAMLVGDSIDIIGNFLDSGSLVPRAATEACADIRQLFGEVWEWTRSPFMPYPGFKPVAEPQGEYNGKFNVQRDYQCT
jgi:hypothetical protein